MSGYEYGNTRVRAMRSRLLSRNDYVEMMTAGTLDRVLALLAETEYRVDVESALVRASGLRRLDEATRSNLARTLRAVASFYSEEPGRRVDLLLNRWDWRNLRTLLRLPEVIRASPVRARLLVPAGRLDGSALAELATQPELRSLIDLLVAWGVPSRETATALATARARYEVEGDPAVLELALDRAYADEIDDVFDDEKSGPASILRSEIDMRNIELSLRLRAARLDHEPGWSEVTDGYVRGGLVPLDVWPQVPVTDPAESIAQLLIASRILGAWVPAVQAWSAHDDLVRLCDDLRKATTAAAVERFVTGDVLGFDVPLAFAFAKESEVRNVRLVGRGIVHGISVDEIEARLEVAA